MRKKEKIKPTSSHLKPIYNLINSLIAQAVSDYRRALKAKDKIGIEECEEFFRSERFIMMTRINGEWLIKKIREEVKHETNKLSDRRDKGMCNLSQQGA